MAPFYTEFPFPAPLFEKFVRENNGGLRNPQTTGLACSDMSSACSFSAAPHPVCMLTLGLGIRPTIVFSTQFNLPNT